MRGHLGSLVLVGVTSSLATVAALELLRRPRAAEGASEAVAPPAAPDARGTSGASGAPALEPAPSRASSPERDDAWEARLGELERRLGALELASRSRAPLDATSPAPAAAEELRTLVLDWVAEDREARRRAEEEAEEQAKSDEVEWGARYHAMMLAREHGLADWQREELAKVFLEVERRRAEIEASIDLEHDDPLEVEERWNAFDEWADEREREGTLRVDPELYRALYGDD